MPEVSNIPFIIGLNSAAKFLQHQHEAGRASGWGAGGGRNVDLVVHYLQLG